MSVRTAVLSDTVFRVFKRYGIRPILTVFSTIVTHLGYHE